MREIKHSAAPCALLASRPCLMLYFTYSTHGNALTNTYNHQWWVKPFTTLAGREFHKQMVDGSCKNEEIHPLLLTR